MVKAVNFEFPNQVTPKHIESFFLEIRNNEWYSINSLIEILKNNNKDINSGKNIVQRNVATWIQAGIGFLKTGKEDRGKRVYFQISPFGHYLQEIYSTNNVLFFEIIHFIFYSTWLRTNDIRKARFWVYKQVCDDLWVNAPSKMDSFNLASRIQSLAHETFPDYYPAFSERSARAVFPWVNALTPSFLVQPGAKSEYLSNKRNYCTSQLFNLAIDLIYTLRKLNYGTSLNIDDGMINEVSMICLLDPERFWEMAERTQMMIKGFEVRKSQWGPTITLNQAPNWIELPEFKNQDQTLNEEEDE